MNLKKRLREWRIRWRLAVAALKGRDFIHDATQGFRLTPTSYTADMPDWHRSPESESRAAVLGRVSEATQRYVAIRQVREAYESGDDDMLRTVRETEAFTGGNTGEALRVMERKQRDRAVREIRDRLELEEREWQDSGKRHTYIVRDPRTTWQMRVSVTARDYARGSDRPPSVDQAIQDAPNRLLDQLAGDEAAQPLA